LGCFGQPASSKLDSATSDVLFHGTATCRDADTNEIIAELDFRLISRTVTAKPWSDPTSNPLDELKRRKDWLQAHRQT
jgi:hypothetical protein